MYCQHCGAQIPMDARFCVSCGKPLLGQTEVQPPSISVPEDSALKQSGTVVTTLVPIQPLYFAVSTTKLFVLSLCTFGWYLIYWFYKNWWLIKEREQSNINPVLRSVLFAGFFCYFCFARIRATAKENSVNASLPAGLLTAGWIICVLLTIPPEPYRGLFFFLSICCFLPVQNVANKINKKLVPDHDKNSQFSAINIVTIIIGGSMLLAVIIGSFLLPS